MDFMKINSKFTTGLISKLVNMAIRKKFKREIDVRLNDIYATTTKDEKIFVHLNVDAEMSKEELTEILKSIGLS